MLSMLIKRSSSGQMFRFLKKRGIQEKHFCNWKNTSSLGLEIFWRIPTKKTTENSPMLLMDVKIF